ncbi:hypothetical protein MNB_SV-6-78 [hydrothermal vent metagenome]|uniref:Outer membrane protein beta-barrel domain-containing protein n=1 Tax=hydrothermal vent metagenome TaxID=652676 RepID=A0A1W1BK62_9ZZZZ
MKKELSIVAAFTVLSSVAFAGGSSAPVTVAPVWDVPVEQSKMFVYVSGGATSVEVNDNIQNGIILLPDVLNDSSNVWEGGIGYRHSEDLFATAFVQGDSLDEVSIINFAATVNYRFSDLVIMPYVGAIVGYSKLEWDNIPVDTTGHTNVESKLDADGMTFGLQAGAEYSLGENFTLFGKYQFLTMDHLMEIFKTSEIEHANLQNVQGGVRYEF